ncbi:MAG: hypothetical protein QOH67_1980 [Hyphomicrobiales bacterium]|jgi:hypothetical protein|nr:hypothetical protein [Hyphomicrobiales bacterium]
MEALIDHTMLFTLLTALGPIVAAAGYYFDLSVIFWIGVALAAFNLFMNLASGALKFPWIELGVVAIGSLIFSPWYFGAGIGLVAATALEAIGEALPSRFWRRT